MWQYKKLNCCSLFLCQNNLSYKKKLARSKKRDGKRLKVKLSTIWQKIPWWRFIVFFTACQIGKNLGKIAD